MDLNPNDVPGAKFIFANIEHHSIQQLKRWLECRGLKKSGKKAELVKRCMDCIAAGKEDLISIAVDGGKWYDIKNASTLSASTSKMPGPLTSNTPAEDLSTISSPSTSSTTVSTWKPFPSVDIPPMFNKGHVYVYLVLSAPTLDQNNSSGEEDATDISTEKPFKRGQKYIDSGFVTKMFDRQYEDIYELKCSINSSFRKQIAYTVHVRICLKSGSIIDGSCICKQSALGRCSHVAALLLYLWKYVQENGYNALSCTSRPQQWGMGSKIKSPTSIREVQYTASQMKPIERANYDPRPRSYTNRVNLNDFLCQLQMCDTETMFQSLMCIKYEDFHYSADEENIISKQCEIFKLNLFNHIFQNTNCNVVELSETAGQSNNERWFYYRRYFITASNIKTVLGLQSENAKNNFIKHNLWNLMPFCGSIAMKYGIANEKNARESYGKTLSNGEHIIETGLVTNKNIFFMACSVDGLVLDGNDKKIRVIEIKCPYILKQWHPKDFKNKLSKKQLQNFFLDEKNGIIFVKKNHAYYYQIQTCLLIHEIEKCDLIVWSPQGMIIIEVEKENDLHFINKLVDKVKFFYNNMFVPEMFSMRTPRNLSAILFDFGPDVNTYK